jgi:hypothetical protein
MNQEHEKFIQRMNSQHDAEMT